MVDGEYDKLEALAELLQKETKPFPWSGHQSRFELMLYQLAMPHLLGGGEGHDERIKKWRTARPASMTAKLVEVMWLNIVAWDARGAGFASKVSEERFKAFHAKMEEVRKLIVPIADSAKPPAEVFPTLFEVATAQSWDRRRVDAYVEKLMKIAPRLFSAHNQVVVMRMPRWGGDVPDSEDYARRIADRIGGADGDAVYARAALELQPYYGSKNLLEATGFDAGRIHKGIARLMEEAPDEPDLPGQGMLLAYYAMDKEQGRSYLAKLAPHDQQWSTPILFGTRFALALTLVG